MKLMRKLLIPAFAGIMTLAGASSAMAMTSAAAPAAVHSATAVSVTDTVHLTASPAITWYYYSQYPTQAACNSEGSYLYFSFQIGSYNCVQMNEGDFYVWYLYFALGHGPGS